MNLHRLQFTLFAATLKNDKLRGFKMVATYHAMLRAGKLDWGVSGLPDSLKQLTVPVELTLLPQQSTQASNGTALAAILEKLAASNVAEAFGDPLEWQREVRNDRPLDGREE